MEGAKKRLLRAKTAVARRLEVERRTRSTQASCASQDGGTESIEAAADRKSPAVAKRKCKYAGL